MMRLRFVPGYVDAFREVFGTDWPNIAQAWLAIAAFERTIVTDAALVPFDRYLAGDANAMSADARSAGGGWRQRPEPARVRGFRRRARQRAA